MPCRRLATRKTPTPGLACPPRPGLHTGDLIQDWLTLVIATFAAVFPIANPFSTAHLVGHAAVLADPDQPLVALGAPHRVAIPAEFAMPARYRRLDTDRGPVVEHACELVAHREWERPHLRQVQVGLADPDRLDLDANAVAGRLRQVGDFNAALGSTNSSHGRLPSACGPPSLKASARQIAICLVGAPQGQNESA